MGVKFTAQTKFSIKNFFSKCNQIRRKLRIWSHLLKKCLMEKFIFCAVALKVQITPTKTTMYYALIIVCFHKEQYFLGASSQPRQTSKIEGFAE